MRWVVWDLSWRDAVQEVNQPWVMAHDLLWGWFVWANLTRLTKGGPSVIETVKILALPKRGGGSDPSKVFWWICRCIPKTLLRHHSTQIMIIYPPKSEHLSPKIDHHQQLVNIYPKSNNSLPKMVIYALLSSKCHELHLHAFVVKSTRVPGLG